MYRIRFATQPLRAEAKPEDSNDGTGSAACLMVVPLRAVTGSKSSGDAVLGDHRRLAITAKTPIGPKNATIAVNAAILESR